MKKKCFILLMLVSISLLAFLRTFPSLWFYSFSNTSLWCVSECGLTMEENLFYRQTYNNCGPYSVMAVSNVLLHDKLDPEMLAKEMKWRIIKNLTFPQGVVSLLHKYNIRTKEYTLWAKTDADKATFLRTQIAQGFPIILLIKAHGVLHYVTVLGYDRDGFMLYDSMQEKSLENPRFTIKAERASFGNSWLSDEELVSLWNKGGVKFAFRNWCIVCNVKKKF